MSVPTVPELATGTSHIVAQCEDLDNELSNLESEIQGLRDTFSLVLASNPSPDRVEPGKADTPTTGAHSSLYHTLSAAVTRLSNMRRDLAAVKEDCEL